MKLTITRVQMSGKPRVRVADETGKFYTGEFVSHHDFVRCSNRLRIKEDDLIAAMSGFTDSTPVPYEVELSNLTKPEVGCYLVRGELGSAVGEASKSQSYTTFAEAFDSAKPGQVIEWTSDEFTCCLDIDIHKRVDIERVLSLFSTITPAPVKYWVSSSGLGIHAIYELAAPYTANELAAIAGFRFQTMEPSSTVEILQRTRMPGSVKAGKTSKGKVVNPLNDYTKEIFGSGVQNVEFKLDNLLYSQVDGNDLASMVCDMFDYEVGKRYPHTMCPVMPSVRAGSNSDPVVVHDDHVYCFICAADHVFSGHKAPGWFPFSSLAGLARETNIKHCVKHFVHWGHAQYSFTGDFKYDKLLYRALLKAEHGDDPRIPAAIKCGEPIGIVRHDGFWADYAGTILDVRPNSARLAEFPIAQRIDKNGKPATNKSVMEWLASTSNLAHYGYKAVKPIHGFHMTQLQDLPDDKIFAVLSNLTLPSNKQPRFLAGKDRMPIDDAWATLDTVVPGYHRDLIKTLLIGRGCSEHRSGLSPMLVLTGVTGSGKSSHVDLAGAIFGDTVAKVQYNRDKDRFFNEIMNGKQRSGFIFFDEFFKVAESLNVNPVDAMQILLNFDETETIYMIYVGGVCLGQLPMFVWADSEIPEDVLLHEQIGRRAYHYHLPSEMSWEQTLADSGILLPRNLRLHGNDKIILACNTILSDVLETYFTSPATDFAVVETLGIKKIRNSDKVEQGNKRVLDLFVAVCSLPDRKSSSDLRPGFKELTNPELLTGLQTDTERGTCRCRFLAANDLAKILKLKMPCKAEIESKAGKLFIRFVSFDGRFINERLRGGRL